MTEHVVGNPEHTNPDFQEIEDAIELAFWGSDFMTCDPSQFPTVSGGDSREILNPRMREKSSEDFSMLSPIDVMHLKCDLNNNGEITPQDVVIIYWREVGALYLDVEDGTIEPLVSVKDGSNPFEGRDIWHLAKVGLAAVNTILD